jgi:phage terminase large subunit-like protein
MQSWGRQGYALINEGNVVDYSVVRQQIEQAAERYNIQGIAFDRYNASQLVIELQDQGFNMQPFRQGIVSMSGPTKEFERLCLQELITHDHNPLMDWQMENIAIKRDSSDNIKISKESELLRVDGPVALVMALGQAMDSQQNAGGHSILESDTGLW